MSQVQGVVRCNCVTTRVRLVMDRLIEDVAAYA